MEADATGFRVAAGQLCPGSAKVLRMLLPAAPETTSQPRVAWEKEGGDLSGTEALRLIIFIQ